MSNIKRHLIVPVRVIKQSQLYTFSCVELSLIEQNVNFYMGFEQMKQMLIQRYSQLSRDGEELPLFNMDRAIKQGAVFIEIPPETVSSKLTRITLTIPDNVISSIKSENRSKDVTQILQQHAEAQQKQ